MLTTSARTRALCGLVAILVAVVTLVAVGGAHRSPTRTSASAGQTAAAAPQVARAVDTVASSPVHAPSLDPAVLPDAPAAPAPRGTTFVDAVDAVEASALAPTATGRGPPTR